MYVDPNSKRFPDTKQRITYCVKEAREDAKSSLISDVHDELLIANATWDDECDEFVQEVIAEVYDEDGNALGNIKVRLLLISPELLTVQKSVYVKTTKGMS